MAITRIENPHNLDALLLGTAEFKFCRGATSIADAAVKGYRDIGNVKAVTPATALKIDEHLGSYRGTLKKDRRRATSSEITYKFKADEWNVENLITAFGGTLTDPVIQSPTTDRSDEICDIMDFSINDSTSQNLYPVLRDGVLIEAATNISAASVASPVTVTGANAGDIFTATGHGLVINDIVYFTGGGLSTPLVAYTYYYVKTAPSADTFTISATLGGSTFALTGDSTSMKFTKVNSVLTAGTAYIYDVELSQIRFMIDQTAKVAIFAANPSIAAGDENSWETFTPLTNVIQEGYGIVVIFDQDADRRPVVIHGPFACSLNASSMGEVNGTSFADFELSVLVLPTEIGKIKVRHKNGQLVAQ